MQTETTTKVPSPGIVIQAGQVHEAACAQMRPVPPHLTPAHSLLLTSHSAWGTYCDLGPPRNSQGRTVLWSGLHQPECAPLLCPPTDSLSKSSEGYCFPHALGVPGHTRALRGMKQKERALLKPKPRVSCPIIESEWKSSQITVQQVWLSPVLTTW